MTSIARNSITSCNPSVEYFSRERQESTSGNSALQAGRKESLCKQRPKKDPLSLSSQEKQEKGKTYNTLGSEPHPFGDDGAWDRQTTEGDEEPANSRSNGWNEDEDQAAVEEHNTWRSTDNHLGDHRELDRGSAENMTEEQRQENKQRLSSLMENEAMTHNTLGSSINFLDDPDAWDRGSAEIESEEEVFEMARSVFGHAQEASR